MTRARTLADLGSASLATDAEATAAASAAAAAVPTGAKNLLYNGAMQVAQRGTSATGITSTGYYTADRWRTGASLLGTWSQTVAADAPTGQGLANSLKVECTTASASPAVNGYFFVNQILEGQDLQRIAKGSTGAQPLTLSFWVKSNVAGLYVVTFQDNDNDRWVSYSYTIDAADTWEKKSVVIAADSVGSIDNDNAASLAVYFALATGSDRASGTLQTTWGSLTLANLFAGQTNLAAATNNYWQITGVQLEVGDTATDFEHKPFAVELAECQRYFEKSYQYETAPGTVVNSTGTITAAPGKYVTWFPYRFSVRKRATPTITSYAPNTGATGNCSENMSANVALTGTLSTGQTGTVPYAVYTSNAFLYLHITASAEL